MVGETSHNEFDNIQYRFWTFSSDTHIEVHCAPDLLDLAGPGSGRHDTLDSSRHIDVHSDGSTLMQQQCSS